MRHPIFDMSTSEAAKSNKRLVEVMDVSFEKTARDALLRHHRKIDERRVGKGDVPRFTETLRLIGGIAPAPRRVCDVATFGGLASPLLELFQIKDITTTGSLDSPGGGALVWSNENGDEY